MTSCRCPPAWPAAWLAEQLPVYRLSLASGTRAGAALAASCGLAGSTPMCASTDSAASDSGDRFVEELDSFSLGVHACDHQVAVSLRSARLQEGISWNLKPQRGTRGKVGCHAVLRNATSPPAPRALQLRELHLDVGQLLLEGVPPLLRLRGRDRSGGHCNDYRETTRARGAPPRWSACFGALVGWAPPPPLSSRRPRPPSGPRPSPEARRSSGPTPSPRWPHPSASDLPTGTFGSAGAGLATHPTNGAEVWNPHGRGGPRVLRDPMKSA